MRIGNSCFGAQSLVRHRPRTGGDPFERSHHREPVAPPARRAPGRGVARRRGRRHRRRLARRRDVLARRSVGDRAPLPGGVRPRRSRQGLGHRHARRARGRDGLDGRDGADGDVRRADPEGTRTRAQPTAASIDHRSHRHLWLRNLRPDGRRRASIGRRRRDRTRRWTVRTRPRRRGRPRDRGRRAPGGNPPEGGHRPSRYPRRRH